MKLVEGEREVYRVRPGRETWVGTLTPDFIRGYFHAFREGGRFVSVPATD